jgi:cell division inhibitor SepF
MSGMWNRTLVYLGLREEPDEAYEGLPERFDPEDDPHAEHAPERPASRGPRHEEDPDEPEPRPRSGRGRDSNVRPLRDAGGARDRRPARAAIVEVSSFDDAEAIGSRYRMGQPVLFDVSLADGATGRRVVDFVSGLTYALRGRLSKVGTKAFLLVPEGVELSNDERRRLGDLGYRLPEGSRT